MAEGTYGKRIGGDGTVRAGNVESLVGVGAVGNIVGRVDAGTFGGVGEMIQRFICAAVGHRWSTEVYRGRFQNPNNQSLTVAVECVRCKESVSYLHKDTSTPYDTLSELVANARKALRERKNVLR